MRIHESLSQWISKVASNTYHYLSTKLADLSQRISQLANRIFKRSTPPAIPRDLNAKVISAPATQTPTIAARLTETPATKTPEKELTLDELNRELDAWVQKSATETAAREKVKKVILNCFIDKTPELSLYVYDDLVSDEREGQYTRISEVPKVIYRLQHLKHLDLHGLGLTSIDEEIGSLPQLTSLDLSHNNLQELPAAFNRLVRLNYLRVDNNQLTRLPDFSHGHSLLMVSATNNKISSIPGGLLLPHLQELKLTNNKIREIPANIPEMDALTRLFLDSNPIETLGVEISKLINSVHLELSNTPLRSLPNELSQLEPLGYLGLGNTPHLTKIPLTLAHKKGVPLEIFELASGVTTSLKARYIAKGLVANDVADNILLYFKHRQMTLQQYLDVKQTNIDVVRDRHERVPNPQHRPLYQLQALLQIWAVTAIRLFNFEYVKSYSNDEMKAIEQWLERQAWACPLDQQEAIANDVMDKLEILKNAAAEDRMGLIAGFQAELQ